MYSGWILDFRFRKERKEEEEEEEEGISNQIRFCNCLLDWFLLLNSSPSFLKSVSQWVTKCEICILTSLTNHLTAMVQKELERWWLFLTHQKMIYGFKTACLQFDLYYIWLLCTVLCLKITKLAWIELRNIISFKVSNKC